MNNYKKIINQLKLKISNAKNIIEKVSYEIDYYNILLQKAKSEQEVEKALEYKKQKLTKELEYISLIESQQEIKAIKLKEFLNKNFKEIEKIKTDIKAIDNNLGGIPIGVMIQFAARSYAGKTTTLIRIGLNIAKHEKVAHFNFEMSEIVLINILKKMTSKHINQTQLENYLILHDSSNKLEDIIRNIKLLFYKEKVRIFIIDSRMKITTSDKTLRETATNISKKLSELVKELGITIILINQLSEEAIKENRIVLKESGDQFYDADIVLALGFKYLKEKDEMGRVKINENVRTIFCDKNRIGKRFEDEIYYNEIF